jgi:predicted DsbA family dithiol-disulfide isomerase
MNMVSAQPARLALEIVFDFVCPWCYLGIHRLNLVRRRRPDLDLDIVWRPFLLNPDMPRAGMGRTDYAVRKFGGEDRARRLYATITDLAAAEGLHLDFGQIKRTPSSVDAHRLIRFAATLGPGMGAITDRLVDAIFAAYFAHGSDIGNPEVLSIIAASHGLDSFAAQAWLETNEAVELIHADNLHAHRLGINGVPCFLIDGVHAIAGAQEPEVLERLLDLAQSDRRAGA